jgi:hypothetical protein
VEEESGNEGDVPRYVPISLIEKSDDLVKVPGGKNYRFREIVENE